MTNRVIQFAVIGALSCVAVASAHAQTKFAYVNSQKIMSQAPGRAEAEAEFGREREKVQTRVQRLQDSMRVLMAAYEKDAPKLDSVALQARASVLRDRKDEFEAQARILDSTLEQKQNDLARPLMEQVSKVLDEIRVKGGYAMIFDVAGGAGIVVSADTTLDVSEQVLARLKELGPPKPVSSSSSAPAPGPVRPPSGVPPRK